MNKKKLILWLVLLVLLIAAVIGGYLYLASSAQSFVSAIEDPTEKGLAYVAVAIIFHAIIHSNKTTCEVKK